MKVKDLIKLLKEFNPHTQVIISRDVDSSGYGKIKDIITGVYTITDYGNDFFPDTDLIVGSSDVAAICLVPEEDSSEFSHSYREEKSSK